MAEVKMKEESGNFAYLDKIIEIYNNKTQKNMKTEMVEICKKGPYLAQVRKIDVNWNHKAEADIIGFRVIK